MVKEVESKDVIYFQCEVCRFHYEDKEWAGKCQAWCEVQRLPNINITKNVVEVR